MGYLIITTRSGGLRPAVRRGKPEVGGGRLCPPVSWPKAVAPWGMGNPNSVTA